MIFGQTQYPAINTFFSSSSLSLGGAGYLHSDLLSLKSNPAVSNINRLFTTSIINYKNGISSQSIGFNLPLKRSNVLSSLKNISYGTFKKYDENKTLKGTYQSSDSWFTIAYSRKAKSLPLRLGMAYDHLFLSLEDYFFQSYFISLGSEVILPKKNTHLGISINQINFNKSNYNNRYTSPDIVFSIFKSLEHLPLKVYVDLISKGKLEIEEIFFGGIFKIKYNFELYIGSSSRKFNQNINNQLLNTVFGASGTGISYSKDLTSVKVGTYMYGTGYVITSLQIDIKF